MTTNAAVVTWGIACLVLVGWGIDGCAHGSTVHGWAVLIGALSMGAATTSKR